MLKIYHVAGTRSVRPIWLCYELDIPFEIKTIDFSTSFRDSPEWRAISPAGKVPAMTDGELTMFESGAIMNYILERYGSGRLCPPAGTAESGLHHQWCWFSEATLSRPLGLNRLLQDNEESGKTVAIQAQKKARVCLETVEHAIADREFLLGSEFGASDIMMGYSLLLLAHLSVLDDQYPLLLTYLERLKNRPACIRAMNS